MPSEGFTEEGILELMRLFLRKDRPESNWVMLRAMGYCVRESGVTNRYDDMLQWKTTKENVHAQIAGRSLDFNEAGVYYLYQVGVVIWIVLVQYSHHENELEYNGINQSINQSIN